MKKLMTIALTCLAVSAVAAPKDYTLEQWLKARKNITKKAGKPYDAAKETARFKKFDKDGNGVVTAAEKSKK